MRIKKSFKKRHQRRQSYLLTDEQLEWLKSVFPYFTNRVLSSMIFKRFGIEMSAKSIKNMGFRRCWRKDSDLISSIKSQNAHITNMKRWGTL